jgi:long-chain acyl-CoA synthetase
VTVRTVEAGLADPRNQDRPLVEVVGRNGVPTRTFTYHQIRTARGRLASQLRSLLDQGSAVGLVAGNTPEWLVADLALLAGAFVEVPVPLAFSAEQAGALLAGTSVCLVDDLGARRLDEWGLPGRRRVIHIPLEDPGDGAEVRDDGDPAEAVGDAAHDRIVKIIHTSGTTGVPKGVRIRRRGLEALLDSLFEVIPDGAFRRYLSLVPLSLLIEQVAAAYLPIHAGGTVVMLPADEPLLGTAGSRAENALGWLRRVRPTASVLPPAVVSALDKAVAQLSGDPVPALFGGAAAPFLMAGGAPVDAAALRRLTAAGIDVFEGYGLSENSSVVTWNRPGDNQPGSVGRPLSHCEVDLAADGELLVRSTSLFAGYTVEDPTSRPVDDHGWLHTGDRADIDATGRVRILGRLKNVLITSHGRNVSPEWVEGRLRSCPDVRDCVVFGDGLEHLVALVLAEVGADPVSVREQLLRFAEKFLAETDRPERVFVVDDQPGLRARYFTVTGRPLRDLIFSELVLPRLRRSQPSSDPDRSRVSRLVADRAGQTTYHPRTTP